jgi:hypothetical protein
VRHPLVAIVLLACVAWCVSCGGSVTAPSAISSLNDATTITFDGLGANGGSVTTYTEAGLNLSAMSGDWTARTDYGHPAPFIQFSAPNGGTATGEIQVRASGSVYFKSIDLYSSTTPIPYTITGLKNGSAVFTMTDTLPNTFGDFRTVFNPHSAEAIDTLAIVLTNAAAACCRNPMGLDTIVLTATPSAAPTTFSLSGQVTDAASGAGIPNANIAISDGPNAGRSIRTDGSGNYTLADLRPSGFTVNVAASNYLSQSKGVTLTSNQTLSVQLTPQQASPAPPVFPSGATVIGFNGLTANGGSVESYAESGFTVSAASGPWQTVTTYGNPAPFIQFFAPAQTAVTAEVRVSGGGSLFSFLSVDLYSSTTPIPYKIIGLRNASSVFSVTSTLPNTFGNFKTVAASDAAAKIDALSIVLTNTAAACCRNPMGLDTIVLMR